MIRRACFFFLFFFFFFSCCFVPSSLSLSSTQSKIMGKLSQSIPVWKDEKEANPCRWKGVNCSSDDSSVTNISLSRLSLSQSGFLPLVCQIASLEALDLSNNQIPSIPPEFFTACGNITGLNALNFSNNRLVGPLPDFTTGFPGLESLDFSGNSLNGSIVSQLGSLIRLKHLRLTSNKFSGPIPIKLGGSTALQLLQLNLNSFTGPIPDQLLQYSNLYLIDLSYNQLSGPLPPTIAARLPRLQYLILSSNNFSGQIPEQLSNIRTLSRFAANQNNFTGSIPGELSTFLQNLDLSYNQLRGQIPDGLLKHPNLESVDLSSNMLQGSMPTVFSPKLMRLRLGNNSLNGTIPSALGNLTYLTYLELDSNNFSGSIPPQLASCRRLALLNLGMNHLTGPLPEGLAGLDSLQVLKLHSNQLEGEIPTQINQMHGLSILNMSGNLVTGSIPTSISGMLNLTNLNLQDNRLTGSIPPRIESLKNLLELQLGKNQLSGDIPRMPVSLQIALNLSHNHFQGQIPDSLSRLMNLEVLDLSNNNLSGGIPPSLTKLSALTQLLLANNQLSGEIPKFGSYVTTLDTNGNAGLFNGTKPSQEQDKRVPSKRKPVGVVVAVAAVIGAAAAAAALGIGVMVVSRRFYRVKEDDEGLEEMPHHQVAVVQANLLTANGIHRSNIDFSRAMEAVGPSNMLLKTRFSTYYKAVMPSGTSYLVKKTMDLNWRGSSSNHEKKLKLLGEELEVLGKLSNSNVMTPLAYVLSMDSTYLLYEYAHKGTLFDILHLHHHGDGALDWASRYSIAVGIAQGLAFLHASSSSSPLLLLDLSTKTVMLKSVKEPQIGDIELYKLIASSRTARSLSTVAGSVGYVPPEYAYTMRVTAAGNVYSFGVILLELLTGKPPVSEGTELAKWALDNTNTAQQHKLDRILDSNISRTSLAVRTQMLAVLKVALACITFVPESRPKMKTVLRMLLNAR